MAKHKLLSHEETMELIGAAQSGSEEAKEKLVDANTRLIWNMVQRYKSRGYDLEDIFQIGAIGLLRAIDKFDMSYEVKFTTYAVPMIMGEIQRFLRDDGAVRVSRSIKELSYKIKRDELLDKSPEHICEVLGEKSIEQVKLAIQYITKGQVSSMDEVFFNSEDGDDITLADRMESDVNGNNWFNNIALRRAIEHLSPRERRIIALRYYQDRTQSEVAKELGVSQVQVSRLEKRILTTLKELLEEEDVEMAKGVKGTGAGDRDKAVHLLKFSSYTLKEIHEATGVPLGTMGTLAKQHRPEEITEAIKARTKALKKEEKPVVTPVIDIPEFKGELDKKKEEKKVKKENEVGQHFFVDGDKITETKLTETKLTLPGGTEIWRVAGGIAAVPGTATIATIGTETGRLDVSKSHSGNVPQHEEPVKPSTDIYFNFRTEGKEMSKEEVINSLKTTMDMVKLYPGESVALYVRVGNPDK